MPHPTPLRDRETSIIHSTTHSPQSHRQSLSPQCVHTLPALGDHTCAASSLISNTRISVFSIIPPRYTPAGTRTAQRETPRGSSRSIFSPPGRPRKELRNGRHKMGGRLRGIDALFVTALFLISIWRRLWIINWPESTVFDEVHFGNFTNFYINSTWFFDIHPPLGKLIMFLFAKVGEYPGNIEFVNHFTRRYPSEDYVMLRLTPAWFSSLCSPMLYLVSRFDGFSPVAALVAGFMVATDTSMLSEHRFILSDGILHFWCCFFLLCYSYTNSLEHESPQWNAWLLVSGCALGAASSCKNTAWGLIAYAGLIQLMQVIYEYPMFSWEFVIGCVNRACRLLVPVVVIYMGSFAVHFAVCRYVGCLDDVTVGFNERLTNRSLDAQMPSKRVTGRNVFWKSINLSLQMHRVNLKVSRYHPSESRPYTWPFLSGRNVGFWSGRGSAAIACQGNVFVYYLVNVALVAGVFAIRSPLWKQTLYYMFGWTVCYFPFLLIKRAIFLYHYILPLMIGCLVAGATLDLYFSRFYKGFFAFVIIMLCEVGFFLWSPYSYGTSPYAPKYAIWSTNWLYGDEKHKTLLSAALEEYLSISRSEMAVKGKGIFPGLTPEP